MANNRLMIVDDETGDVLCIAKAYPSTGWYPTDGAAHLAAFLESRDVGGTCGGPTRLRLADENDAAALKALCGAGSWRPPEGAASSTPMTFPTILLAHATAPLVAGKAVAHALAVATPLMAHALAVATPPMVTAACGEQSDTPLGTGYGYLGAQILLEAMGRLGWTTEVCRTCARVASGQWFAGT